MTQVSHPGAAMALLTLELIVNLVGGLAHQEKLDTDKDQIPPRDLLAPSLPAGQRLAALGQLPANGATSVAASTNATATFSGAMNASTVNGDSFAG